MSTDKRKQLSGNSNQSDRSGASISNSQNAGTSTPNTDLGNSARLREDEVLGLAERTGDAPDPSQNNPPGTGFDDEDPPLYIDHLPHSPEVQTDIPLEPGGFEDLDKSAKHPSLADIFEHLSHQQRTLAQIQAYLADKDNQTVIETAAQSGVRSALPRILEGTLVVAGVSTVTLLVIGGLAPLLIPAATGTLTTTIAVSWLTNIGSSALATWIQGLAEKSVRKLFSQEPTEHTQELAQAIGPELEADMRKDRSLASALTNMLEKLDIRRMMSDTIAGGLKIHSAVLARLEDERRAQQQENAELRSITSYLIEQLTQARAQSTQPSNTLSSPSTAPHADAHPSTGPPMTEQDRQTLEDLLHEKLNE